MKDGIFIGVSSGHIILGLGRLRKKRLERERERLIRAGCTVTEVPLF